MEEMIRVGILTVSDRCSRGERIDESGPAIREALPKDQFISALYAVIADDKKTISDTLRRWCDEMRCDVIFTTGGTGFAPRDVTPEATHKVIEREAPHISQYLAAEGLKKSPFAALSRGAAGVRGQTVIINLPGSPIGAREGAQAMIPLLGHLVNIIKSQETEHPKF